MGEYLSNVNYIFFKIQLIWNKNSQEYKGLDLKTLSLQSQTHYAKLITLIQDVVYRLQTSGAYIALLIKYRLDFVLGRYKWIQYCQITSQEMI